MAEASRSTPLFFILFPGYSPSKDVEVFAASQERTVKNGKLTLISMGQVTPPFNLGLKQQLLYGWQRFYDQGTVKTVWGMLHLLLSPSCFVSRRCTQPVACLRTVDWHI